MKYLRTLILAALAGVSLLLVSSCMKEFKPESQEDFIGTEWGCKEEGGQLTLVFLDTKVLLIGQRTGAGDESDLSFQISGSYSYDGAGNVLTLSFTSVDKGKVLLRIPTVYEGYLSGRNKLVLLYEGGEQQVFKRQKPSRQ